MPDVWISAGTLRSEAAAMCDEALLENYLESGTVTEGNLRELIARRKLFPCCFGSGMKLEGIERLLELLDVYAPQNRHPQEFAARVYKISRDPQGARLTWLKVTGGSLKVRSVLPYANSKGEQREEKKENQASQKQQSTDEKIDFLHFLQKTIGDDETDMTEGEGCRADDEIVAD